jgi:hypothetical protein
MVPVCYEELNGEFGPRLTGTDGATRAAITSETETGALVLNYHGFSRARQWGFGIFYDRPEIGALANGTAQPFVVSHGTQNALFAAPTGPGAEGEASMIETYVRQAGNGAVAAAGPAEPLYFYLVTGINVCGEGPVGSQSFGPPRPQPSSCPPL